MNNARLHHPGMMHHCIGLRKPFATSRADGERMSLRETISELLREKQMSQRRLAEAAGIDQPSLSKFLSGQTQDILAGNLVAIADALGVTVGYLTGETYDRDRKIAVVARAMERMPEYKKDAVVAAAEALAGQLDDAPRS